MVKKSLLIIIIVFLTAALAACGEEEERAIFEEEEKIEEFELEIAVVDKSQIWGNSLQAEHYQAKLKEKLTAIEAELEEAESNNLAETEKVELYDELYSELGELREELRLEVGEKINRKISNVVEDEEYQVVFNKEETRFGGEDITELVIHLLDENFEKNKD